ncbi:hypothetical protein [Thiohalorhabdus methylotrophus]|uniref:Uncharacterized protein n=1 Tax=Thiohalorhabdus methylotrophus TaxID=3242694 RepID=A0ABV4TSK8_9GAMM
MTTEAPQQPKAFCQFPVQLVIEAILMVIAANVPFGLATVVVLAAIALPFYCFAQSEPPQQSA